MICNKRNIAILIFALSQEEEIKRKPFLKNNSLQSNLTSRTITLVKKTGLDYFVYSEQQQLGTSFGERYSNAINDIYAKGYDAVITIGNDTPNLNKTRLLKAVETVQKGQSVIGPSYDGGFYLLGIHKEAFHQKEFSEFQWNTSNVRKELYSYLKSYNTSFYQLDFLYDLDHFSDIINIYKTLPFLLKKLRRVLQIILRTEDKIPTVTEVLLSHISSHIYYNKGSPSRTP
ncbi:TIGR04282 family arsenosugar biosynthesis glycosyltransferase [Aquimarina sp. M1]